MFSNDIVWHSRLCDCGTATLCTISATSFSLERWVYINVRQFVDLCMIFNKRWELHFVYSAVINEYNTIKNKTVLYHSMIKLHVILHKWFKALHLIRSIHFIKINLPSWIYINLVTKYDPPSSQFSCREAWCGSIPAY